MIDLSYEEINIKVSEAGIDRQDMKANTTYPVRRFFLSPVILNRVCLVLNKAASE